jgi:hypothetical protein
VADNIGYTPGTGASIATDEISNIHFQQVKLVDATLGSTLAAIVNSNGELRVAASSYSTLLTAEVRASSGTRTTVAAATGSTQILASNGNRKSSILYNDSSSLVYIGMGSAAVSSSDYTFPLNGGGIYEVEYGYTGIIRAAWVTATGQMRVTEFT